MYFFFPEEPAWWTVRSRGAGSPVKPHKPCFVWGSKDRPLMKASLDTERHPPPHSWAGGPRARERQGDRPLGPGPGLPLLRELRPSPWGLSVGPWEAGPGPATPWPPQACPEPGSEPPFPRGPASASSLCREMPARPRGQEVHKHQNVRKRPRPRPLEVGTQAEHIARGTGVPELPERGVQPLRPVSARRPAFL